MAPCCMASRVISRITDSVKLTIRSLRKRVRKAVTEEDIVRGYVKPRVSVKWGVIRVGPAAGRNRESGRARRRFRPPGPWLVEKERYGNHNIRFQKRTSWPWIASV